jgi:hypothetical protein
MQRYEYRVVPAPTKGEKAKGAKTAPDRFAVALMNVMNSLGADGWDYVRADTLPCEERVGFTGSKTVFQNMLVFRRPLAAEEVEPHPRSRLSSEPLLTASQAATLIAAGPPDPDANRAAQPTLPPANRRLSSPDQAAE